MKTMGLCATLMKTILSLILAFIGILSARAATSIDFSNYFCDGEGAPVYQADGVTPLGSSFFGQLYAGEAGQPLVALGNPVRFSA
jgi:hypothetical protein